MTKKTNGKKLGEIHLFEEKKENLTEMENFILSNQKKDLWNIYKDCLEKYASELVFFQMFTKNNKTNKEILEKAIKDRKIKLQKQFLNEFYFVSTPSEKNMEKYMLEKVNTKMILEYIQNSPVFEDRKNFWITKNLLEKISDLKEKYRKIGYNMLEDTEKKLEMEMEPEDRKKIKLQYYMQQKSLTSEWRKIYMKYSKKALKSRYRLAKKYAFLVSD